MKIVVVGGVAAGASAAARSRRLDEAAEIVMLERGQHVSFANCGLPYHIGGVIRDRDRLLLQTPESLKAALNLDVRVGQEVIRIDRAARRVSVRRLKDGSTYDEAYDRLVLCPGALPVVPPLPGVEHPRVFVLRNVDDMDRIKASVDAGARGAVVIGAGYIGVEMAESLRHRGLEVDVVEMMNQIMPPLDREMTRELESHMAAHGVRLHLGTAAAAFREKDGRLAVELVNGDLLTADLVVLCVGVRPDASLAKAAGLDVGERGGIRVNEWLQTSDPDIYAAGDAVEVVQAVTGRRMQVPLAGPANRQGRAVADHIFGRGGGYANTKGTAVVKIFDMTAGGTGASERVLKAEGVAYRKVYIHPSGHAGYYPGTAPMHVKVLFAPDTGKLLGAQVVGFDGVDKRLDVLATALYAGLTVHDLQHLELAYAPPYGSAKDPVNMAGFVAANLLKGDVEAWYAEDFPAQTSRGWILDVRGPSEYEEWHIPGARNIPLGKLRASLGQLDRGSPVFVYCKVGFRSYLAYRILKQCGFEARTLSGGSLTFIGHHGYDVCEGQRQAPVESYPDERVAARTAPAGAADVDLRGLQCPGPIRKLAEAAQALKPGDVLTAVASDPGFAQDGPAWCRRQGHEVLAVERRGAETTLRLKKGEPCVVAPAAGAPAAGDKKTMVVFSGDLDKVMAAFVIANGALAMGSDVTMFFTFWGLNALRKAGPQAAGKGLLDRMFGWMMPAGARRLTLSKMHMLGMGTAMMKHVMRSKRVDDLSALMEQAVKGGARLVACSMSMDVMGLKREELIDGIDIGGVAAFLGEADGARMTLFI